MIFSVDGHIEMIRNGVYSIFTDEKGDPTSIVKTHTRRLNRGIYQIGKDYAVQRKRGVKAEQDIRIVMDRIWLETRGVVRTNYFLESMAAKANVGVLHVFDIPISEGWALAEGGYTPDEFEKVFRELNPKWGCWIRWAFEYHVIEVLK